MSLTLKVIVTIVVILIVAITVLAIFSGGIGSIGQTISGWINGVPSVLPTGQSCNQLNGKLCDVGKCGDGAGSTLSSDATVGGKKTCCITGPGIPTPDCKV